MYLWCKRIIGFWKVMSNKRITTGMQACVIVCGTTDEKGRKVLLLWTRSWIAHGHITKNKNHERVGSKGGVSK